VQESRLDTIDETSELTPQEERFLDAHVVMGMDLTRAGKLAGISRPRVLIKEPRIAAALAQRMEHVQQRAMVTREDIIMGIKEAVEQARVLGDPRTAIYGWVELNRMLGYDQPTKIRMELSGDAAEMMHQIRLMSDAELLKHASMPALEAEFYEVQK
jgi:hypothetical protein